MSTGDFPQGFGGRRVTYVKVPQRSSVGDTADVVEFVTEILRSFFEVPSADCQSAVDTMGAQTRADTEFAIENVRRTGVGLITTDVALAPQQRRRCCANSKRLAQPGSRQRAGRITVRSPCVRTKPR